MPTVLSTRSGPSLTRVVGKRQLTQTRKESSITLTHGCTSRRGREAHGPHPLPSFHQVLVL